MDSSLDGVFLPTGKDLTLAVPYDEDDPMMRFHNYSGELSASSIGHQARNATTAAADLPVAQGVPPASANNIDWEASFRLAEAAAAEPTVDTQEQDIEFSFSGHPGGDIEIDVSERACRGSNTIQGPAPTTGVDEFFVKNGACRPPVPCDHCRRRRLQCLILQTTAANPNPTKSCSSCVALFRECSLSGHAKRVPSQFETPIPVIGHLHGVKEQDGSYEGLEEARLSGLTVERPSMSALSSRRANTRSVRKTQPLRHWFSSHLDHPYPSEEEKLALAKESDLSKSQVANWFLNARRRHRHQTHTQSNQGSKVFVQGSPMPQPLGMSPMERWRNSPPEEEPVSASALENLLSVPSSSQGSVDNYDAFSFEGAGIWSDFNDLSSHSASSHHTHQPTIEPSVLSRSASSLAGDSTTSSRSTSSTKDRASSSRFFKAFQCTFCRKSYKKKYDWARHERSVHLPGLDAWICAAPVPADQPRLVWHIHEREPRCIFCGLAVTPAGEQHHLRAHEFEACASRPVAERRFTRKDHLWQHLQKFHRCRHWDGWKPELSLLHHRREAVRSRCGFCQAVIENWEDRVEHLAAHFRAGLTMDSWIGGHGIEDMESNEPAA